MSAGTRGSGGDHDPHARPWIHPSELPADPDGPPRAPRLPRVTVPLAAGLAGALIAFGATALVLSDGRGGTVAPASTAGLLPGRLTTTDTAVAAVAKSAAAGIVGVTIWRGSMAHYGSGVVYRPERIHAARNGAFMVTTAALVRDATGIEVNTADGRTAAAEVVGVDVEYDLALLYAALPSLAAMDFDASGTVAVGEPCVLVGAGPRAEGTWAAGGAIAAVGRVVNLDGSWMVDLLEVDQRLAPEGAGGALLDPSGQLIGLLTDAGDESVAGTLAVPTGTTRRSADQLIAHGRVEHPWLGLAATDAVAPVSGAVVREVVEGGPAAGAGLHAGDVILEVGTRPVRGMTSLLREVRRHETGERVVLRVRRGTEELVLTVRLDARPHAPSDTP